MAQHTGKPLHRHGLWGRAMFSVPGLFSHYILLRHNPEVLPSSPIPAFADVDSRLAGAAGDDGQGHLRRGKLCSEQATIGDVFFSLVGIEPRDALPIVLKPHLWSRSTSSASPTPYLLSASRVGARGGAPSCRWRRRRDSGPCRPPTTWKLTANAHPTPLSGPIGLSSRCCGGWRRPPWLMPICELRIVLLSGEGVDMTDAVLDLHKAAPFLDHDERADVGNSNTDIESKCEGYTLSGRVQGQALEGGGGFVDWSCATATRPVALF